MDFEREHGHGTWTWPYTNIMTRTQINEKSTSTSAISASLTPISLLCFVRTPNNFDCSPCKTDRQPRSAHSPQTVKNINIQAPHLPSPSPSASPPSTAFNLYTPPLPLSPAIHFFCFFLVPSNSTLFLPHTRILNFKLRKGGGCAVKMMMMMQQCSSYLIGWLIDWWLGRLLYDRNKTRRQPSTIDWVSSRVRSGLGTLVVVTDADGTFLRETLGPESTNGCGARDVLLALADGKIKRGKGAVGRVLRLTWTWHRE